MVENDNVFQRQPNQSYWSGKQVLNQLHFRTNASTIIPFLKSKADGKSGHARFSLNSIANIPNMLILPLNDDIIDLSLLNIDIPILDETVKARFLADWNCEHKGKQSQTAIYGAITQIRRNLFTAHTPKKQLDTFELAVSNYQSSGFFSQFDWCMEHWGTADDIQRVTESTFDQPTTYIEFHTDNTSPIIALQKLANTFPSVLFTLLYRYPPETAWNEVQFYPFPPFGY